MAKKRKRITIKKNQVKKVGTIREVKILLDDIWNPVVRIERLKPSDYEKYENCMTNGACSQDLASNRDQPNGGYESTPENSTESSPDCSPDDELYRINENDSLQPVYNDSKCSPHA